MSKVLNLDEVSSEEEKALKIKGNEYQMAAMSVKNFVEISRKEESLVKLGDEASMADQLELYIDMVGMMFPEMGEDVLKTLKLNQLMSIMEFTRDTIEEPKAVGEGKSKSSKKTAS